MELVKEDVTIVLWDVNQSKFDVLSRMWYGMVWYGMVWYGVVWYGMVWYGMV